MAIILSTQTSTLPSEFMVTKLGGDINNNRYSEYNSKNKEFRLGLKQEDFQWEDHIPSILKSNYGTVWSNNKYQNAPN